MWILGPFVRRASPTSPVLGPRSPNGKPSMELVDWRKFFYSMWQIGCEIGNNVGVIISVISSGLSQNSPSISRIKGSNLPVKSGHWSPLSSFERRLPDQCPPGAGDARLPDSAPMGGSAWANTEKNIRRPSCSKVSGWMRGAVSLSLSLCLSLSCRTDATDAELN